jgi:hypothetical protein
MAKTLVQGTNHSGPRILQLIEYTYSTDTNILEVIDKIKENYTTLKHTLIRQKKHRFQATANYTHSNQQNRRIPRKQLGRNRPISLFKRRTP